MTLGIAAIGPGAGEAVLRGLQIVEQFSRGAIGGFVSYAALSDAGLCLRAATQDGGVTALSSHTETLADTTFALPPAALQASRAALMSSGPNRPEPLAQFVLAGAHGTLVTGHRLPNARRDQRPAINQRVLEQLQSGATARAAVSAELAADPLADAGIIALDSAGEVYAGNTERVRQRKDIGLAMLRATDGRAVAVLHNSVRPVRGLAELVGQLVLDRMQQDSHAHAYLELRAGTPIRLGPSEALILSADGQRIESIQTNDAAMLQPHFQGSIAYAGAPVVRGTQTVGYLLDEPYVVLEGTKVASSNGQAVVRLGYRLQPMTEIQRISELELGDD